jgi:hypothetical protein
VTADDVVAIQADPDDAHLRAAVGVDCRQVREGATGNEVTKFTRQMRHRPLILGTAPQRVLWGHLNEDQREPVRVPRRQLKQAPRLDLGLLLDHDTLLRQSPPRRLQVAHLDEKANGAGRGIDRRAGDLEQAATEEKDNAAF